MSGEKVFEDSQYIKNNCTECEHFVSYYDDYCDDMEPIDQGFCLKDKNDRYGDATITCELFTPRSCAVLFHKRESICEVRWIEVSKEVLTEKYLREKDNNGGYAQLSDVLAFVKNDLLDLSEIKLTKWQRLLVERSLKKLSEHF